MKNKTLLAPKSPQHLLSFSYVPVLERRVYRCLHGMFQCFIHTHTHAHAYIYIYIYLVYIYIYQNKMYRTSIQFFILYLLIKSKKYTIRSGEDAAAGHRYETI